MTCTSTLLFSEVKRPTISPLKVSKLRVNEKQPYGLRRIAFIGGGRGIRTPVGLHPNGFQDRLVVTASIFLRTNQQNYSKKPLLCQAYDSSILFKKQYDSYTLVKNAPFLFRYKKPIGESLYMQKNYEILNCFSHAQVKNRQRRFQKHEKNANRTHDHKTLRPPASVDKKQTIRFLP